MCILQTMRFYFWFCVFSRVGSVPNAEDILKEAEVKLDAVRQKIGQIAEELRGEDLFQFHRAFTPGEFPFFWFTKALIMMNMIGIISMILQ